MIEGGGLGVFRPEEVGPMRVQVAERRRRRRGRRRGRGGARRASSTSSYFQGPLRDWACADQRALRARRSRRTGCASTTCARVIETLADTGSVLELRRDFGLGMVTALARIEGRPLGIIANNPTHLAGAIDRRRRRQGGALHAALRRLRPARCSSCATRRASWSARRSRRRALVRHAARLFVVGASLTVPFFTIVLRKGYGLGAQAMAGGSFKAPLFTVAWPTGEFGGMGLEGAVKLGFRKRARRDRAIPPSAQTLFDEMVARMYEHGKALNTASHFEIDDVIDPADSRRWILAALGSAPEPAPRPGKKRPCIDTW